MSEVINLIRDRAQPPPTRVQKLSRLYALLIVIIYAGTACLVLGVYLHVKKVEGELHQQLNTVEEAREEIQEIIRKHADQQKSQAEKLRKIIKAVEKKPLWSPKIFALGNRPTGTAVASINGNVNGKLEIRGYASNQDLQGMGRIAEFVTHLKQSSRFMQDMQEVNLQSITKKQTNEGQADRLYFTLVCKWDQPELAVEGNKE